jgi:hypothetical protein
MKYLDGNNGSSGRFASTSGGGAQSKTYGRVTKVHTTSNEDGVDSINSINFSLVRKTTESNLDSDNGTFTAYPLTSEFLALPIVGEVVEIYAAPKINTEILVVADSYYYSRIINLWNNPKDSLFFDTKRTIPVNPLHDSVDLNPLRVNPGDTLIQGRYGQIIRFHQEQDNGKPRIFLGTGRDFESPAVNQVELDINKSQSGVEFVVDGTSPLTTVKTFDKSFRSSEKPKTSNTYKGEQILINTGRVVINSEEESTLISSKEAFAVTSNTINQEAAKEICLESPKIYLGKNAMISNTPEPVLLGNQVEQYLKDILDELIRIADSLNTAVTAAGDTLPILSMKAGASSGVLKALRSKLNPIGESTLKSKKSFTE